MSHETLAREAINKVRFETFPPPPLAPTLDPYYEIEMIVDGCFKLLVTLE